MARKGMKLVRGVYVPLKGKKHCFVDITCYKMVAPGTKVRQPKEDTKLYGFKPEDIKSAVAGLIKFHEDRIEELIKKLKKEKIPIWYHFTIEEIKHHYESIMAIEHWLEDMI